ncbi:MAG TPA: hybrid sensor histidine kinase/response regulator [Deltaproteobacteria bacterium]|nr:hybrid sensor histidine kinase/response regulator [Deltaproteobacteria bacterium]
MGSLREFRSSDGIGNTGGITTVHGRSGLGRGVDQKSYFQESILRKITVTEGRRILVVDDEQEILTVVTRVFESQGYKVIKATSGEMAIELLEKMDVDIVITDLYMKDISGIEVLRHVKEKNPHIYVIILTASRDVEAAVTAIRYGVDDYLLKPCDLKELYSSINRCLRKQKSRKYPPYQLSKRCPYCDETRDLLISASHDLRASIVALAAMIKLILKGSYGFFDKIVGQKLAELYEKTISLMELTEDFFSEAYFLHKNGKTEKEKLEIKKDVIWPVLAELNKEFREANASAESVLTGFPDRPLYINANRVWLKMIFRNLIMNALKHGGKGCRIEVGVKDLGTVYEFLIFNSGRALPAENKEKIFEKFTTGVNEMCDETTGLGLGLYLVKNVIGKFGGDIHYEPTEGGSKFVFTLPKE